MRKTGLFDLISHHLVHNLYDYVLGVETGLDSNGRKNRGGHQMEDLVESYIKEAAPAGSGLRRSRMGNVPASHETALRCPAFR